MSMSTPAYKRILLKLSGEALMGDDSYGINREVIERIVAEIAEVAGMGVQVAIVIGEVISSAVLLRLRLVWTGRPPIIWACWPR